MTTPSGRKPRSRPPSASCTRPRVANSKPPSTTTDTQVPPSGTAEHVAPPVETIELVIRAPAVTERGADLPLQKVSRLVRQGLVDLFGNAERWTEPSAFHGKTYLGIARVVIPRKMKLRSLFPLGLFLGDVAYIFKLEAFSITFEGHTVMAEQRGPRPSTRPVTS